MKVEYDKLLWMLNFPFAPVALKSRVIKTVCISDFQRKKSLRWIICKNWKERCSFYFWKIEQDLTRKTVKKLIHLIVLKQKERLYQCEPVGNCHIIFICFLRLYPLKNPKHNCSLKNKVTHWLVFEKNLGQKKFSCASL